MKKKSVLVVSVTLLAFMVFGFLLVERRISGSKESSQSPERVAVSTLNAMVAGNFKTVTSQFDTPMAQALPGNTLSDSWASLARYTGQFRRIKETRKGVAGPYRIVTLRCEFERAIVDVQFSFNPRGQISGLWTKMV